MDYRTILLEQIELNGMIHESSVDRSTDKQSIRFNFARLLESRVIASQLNIAFNDIENAEQGGRNNYHKLRAQEVENKGFSIHNL